MNGFRSLRKGSMICRIEEDEILLRLRDPTPLKGTYQLLRFAEKKSDHQVGQEQDLVAYLPEA